MYTCMYVTVTKMVWVFFQEEKESMRRELEKDKTDVESERNSYWEGILKQKQQENEELLSNKVKINKYILYQKSPN